MLSYIYSVIGDFERRHGHMPNLLYINTEHLARLQQCLEGAGDMSDIMRFLGMHIVISREAAHPKVAWSDNHWVSRSAV